MTNPKKLSLKIEKNVKSRKANWKVAVKYPQFTASSKSSFQREIETLMKYGKDEGNHIVRYLGLTERSPEDDFGPPRYGPPMPGIVMEYMEAGDLKNYISKFRRENSFSSSRDMTMKRLMKMCADVADGMMYLSRKSLNFYSYTQNTFDSALESYYYESIRA